MAEIWDSYPTNIGETSGPIVKKPFTFNYRKFEVWKGGSCIHSGFSNGIIKATVINGNLFVTLDNNSINNFIKQQFSFKEISTNLDRVMWSKDIFNTSDSIETNTPDISSLFFKQGILNKVTYTIHDPNTLIEFYS